MKENGIILLTTDLSEAAECAFAPARRIAEAFAARIVLVHVEEIQLPALPDADLPDLRELLDIHRQRARDQLERLARSRLGCDVPVELQTAAGTPHVEIVRLAEQREADLIVIATHGRGFLSRVALGSTTERVLRRAPCPVLAVRIPDSDA